MTLRLKFFIFRTGNGDHFRVACSVKFCIFHGFIIPYFGKNAKLLENLQTRNRFMCLGLVNT